MTTAEIAAAAGMREGNLHYHFRKKEQLATALFALFEAEMLRVAAPDLADPADPGAYVRYLRGWFRLMWAFRCFYRDAVSLLAIAPALRPRLRALQDRAQAQVRRTLDEAVAHGLMRATPEQRQRLLDNAWIVSSYWMDYLHARTGADRLSQEQLLWGFAQIQSLYQPYLTEKALALLDGPPGSWMRDALSDL